MTLQIVSDVFIAAVSTSITSEFPIGRANGIDFVPFLRQTIPVEYHDTGGRMASATFDDGCRLVCSHSFTPVRHLQDRPDFLRLVFGAADSQQLTQHRGLSYNPADIVDVAKASVVRHDAENIQILRLSFQINGQLVANGSIQVLR